MTQGEVITHTISNHDMEKKYTDRGLLEAKLIEKGFIIPLGYTMEPLEDHWIFRQHRHPGPIKSAEDHIGENVERGD